MSDARSASEKLEVSLLTGGGDRPYAFGLTHALVAHGVSLDLIASDELDEPSFHGRPEIRLLNLRGDARPDVSFASKATRVLRYYARLMAYAAKARPRIFHILWNNRFEWFDRTLLMLYYRSLGKKLILTLHNVNAGRRDGKDSVVNRLTLRTQYRLADHIFLHTEKMKHELVEQFDVPDTQITVIPFGINNSVPNTLLTCDAARERLHIRQGERTILFFGNIAPYKGLEYLVGAFEQVAAQDKRYRLIIAGRPKNCEKYWAEIQQMIEPHVKSGHIIVKAEFIPDEDTEIYFKAADVIVLPYTHIYQSGVLFLAYSFGLPVLASDVGSLRDEIVEGKTGFVFAPEDAPALAKTIKTYFSSELYCNLGTCRGEIAAQAAERNSWDGIAPVIVKTYSKVLQLRPRDQAAPSTDSSISFEMKTP